MPRARKICVVTGTRAEYGLLKQTIAGIAESRDLELQLIVTGTHLSEKHGLTKNEIIDSGIRITREVDLCLADDTPAGIARSTANGIVGMAAALDDLEPDLLLVLGDRYELLSSVIPALYKNIPVAHIHGGERSEGAIDESIRHAVTKLSHLHFVAHDTYRKRLIQLGEEPNRVFKVGGLGVDAISGFMPVPRTELEASMDFRFQDINLLVTFHPVTTEPDEVTAQCTALLRSLAKLPGVGLIITMPNADPGRDTIFQQIRNFCDRNQYAKCYDSLGQRRYLSCLSLVDGVVGNSSSGLLEAPSFGIGTVNIGTRQEGRVSGDSVIHCDCDEISIDNALGRLLEPGFRGSLSSDMNPFGPPGASKKIVEILTTIDLGSLKQKKFFDVPTS